MNELRPDYKAGYVAIMGRPNSGKSTLINAFVGQKIAAVSHRPQTTRRRQLGILTLDNAQIIFIDTPGMHKPVHKLGEYMNEEARAALDDADVIVFMVDASQPVSDEDKLLSEQVKQLNSNIPIILAVNKIDLFPPEELPVRQAAFLQLIPVAYPQPISAVAGRKMNQLLDAILERLPIGQPFYEEDQVTDYFEREIAGELVREAVMNFLHDEMPHVITVRVDEYSERNENNAYIAATLFVERESQKGIVIGQGGSMLKKIGSSARREIQTMSGRKIFLDLHVKVQKNWRNNSDALHSLGYFHKEEE